VNKDRLVIRRYIIILYFNILVDLIKIFWEHEWFIRVFLYENFFKDYGYYAKYIYKPRFINLINTPNIFFKFSENKIDKRVHYMFDSEKVSIKKIKRAFTDYKNIYFYIKYRADKILMFLSEKIWFIIAHTRFSTRKKWLINKKNIKEYLNIAKPWDILLTRWNWNASNISIPGFWKHMSMYIWNWKFLKKSFKYKFIFNLKDNIDYIIEATGDGVKIVNIEHLISKNDYLWVSRTNFKKEKVLRSIKNTISNVWKWYDHIFNFHSDKSLVCSELVLKSYAKEFKNDTWINIELENIWMSLTYPPNKFINKLISEQKNKKPSVFPVFFIDSIEKTHENFISTQKEFLKSWKRPKLSLFLN